MSDGTLDDGVYDVIVVDATAHDDGSHSVEVTILTGNHKGEIVGLRTSSLEGDDLDLLGLPGTLTVAGGLPDLRIDD